MNKMKLIVALSLFTSPMAMAGDALTHASQASKHSLLSTSKSVAFSGKVASGIADIPFVAANKIGNVSGDIGHALLQRAGSGKLPITDKVITADPPPKQMFKKVNQDGE